MGQAHLWLKIGPIKVPRPPPGSDLLETDPRNPIWGALGPLGAKVADVKGRGGGLMYALCSPNPGYASAFVVTSSVQMPSLPVVQFVMQVPRPGDFKKHIAPIIVQRLVLMQVFVGFEQDS